MLQDRILDLERKCFKSPWENIPKGKFIFTITEECGEKIIGYVVGRTMGNLGEILRLCVEPGFRKRGVAKNLLNKAIERFKKEGVELVYLEVEKSNLPAISLYEKLGFKRDRLVKRFYRNGEDAIYMRKEIRS